MTDDFNRSFDVYLDYLVEKIKGDWAVEASIWQKCAKSAIPTEAQQLFMQTSEGSAVPDHDDANPVSAVCPDQWARQSNILNCEHVWRFDPKDDLSKDYYDKARYLVDMVIAKGGVRLAAVLNEIFHNK